GLEIAFAGRSNVGKSSLINALTGRNTLARTSHTPGRTQQLNFFDLGDRLMLVDLPGYGYARAARSQVKGWTRLIHAYLLGRPNLRRLCLLIDGRHGLKDSDREIMALLDAAAVNYQIVLTKIDKVPEAVLRSITSRLISESAIHPACHPEVLPTSAHDKIGIPDLRATLAALVGGPMGPT
ncbi:MAG: ribosome biogenesis GTP-binding protein YihA/YsxC, partial [Methyloligellaceae bacterium]